MAKKKSKKQKFKKNLKKKFNKTSGKITVQSSNVMKVSPTDKNKLREALLREYEESLDLPKPQDNTHQKIVEKDKVNYNVAINQAQNKANAQTKTGVLETNGAPTTTKAKTIDNIDVKNIKDKINKAHQKYKIHQVNKPQKIINIIEIKEKKEHIEEVTTNTIDISATKEIIKQELKEEIKKEVTKEIAELDNPKKTEQNDGLNDLTSPFIGIIKENQEKPKKSYIELVLSRIKNSYNEYKIIRKKQKEQLKQEKQANIDLPKLKIKKEDKKVPKTVASVEKDKYYDPYKIKETKKPRHKNPIINFILCIYHNMHIIFNSIGLLIYIAMIIGLIRIRVYEPSTIIYVACIIGFLLFIAISFNKYISGKILTILLSAGMIAAIYYMQYTYDFIRNLNTALYEYKTYYVVTFDNGGNKSIYNINNKKVGLLKDNCTNIERKLNTKIEPVYIEYEDINELFNDFYDQNFRAILVNENQYKYLKNNIQNNRAVKILYEFEANAKK